MTRGSRVDHRREHQAHRQASKKGDMASLEIREAQEEDTDAVLYIVREAFKATKEDEEVAQLVQAALEDPTAKPLVSLLALKENKPAGYILFTNATLESYPSVKATLLAPLAVLPDSQKKGIGGKLIAHGCEILREIGVKLVFLAGYPSYYPRHGFQPAYPLNFEPPYDLPKEHSDGWMVKILEQQGDGSSKEALAYKGKVKCARFIDRQDYWQPNSLEE